MQDSLSDNIFDARSTIVKMKEMLDKYSSKNSKADSSRVAVGAFSPLVEEALSHLEKAYTAAFKRESILALSPDAFNPFNLLELERTYSHLALNDPVRTLVVMKRIVDPNPEVPSRPADERIGNKVSSCIGSLPIPTIYPVTPDRRVYNHLRITIRELRSPWNQSTLVVPGRRRGLEENAAGGASYC